MAFSGFSTTRRIIWPTQHGRRGGYCGSRHRIAWRAAIFAAAALRALGFPPLIIDFEAENDTDHVLAVFRIKGHWGAVAKSNYTGCRYREPVYRSLRELAMSYFNIYFNMRGERSSAQLLAARKPGALRPPGVDDDRGADLVHPELFVRHSPLTNCCARGW